MITLQRRKQWAILDIRKLCKMLGVPIPGNLEYETLSVLEAKRSELLKKHGSAVG